MSTPARRPPRHTVRLSVTALESRECPAADALQMSAVVAAGAYAIGADAGDPAVVAVFQADGTVAAQGTPYGGATPGVRVALGDVDGDGVPDVVTAPGPGVGPQVKVYSGRTGGLIGSFAAYEGTFVGGVFVAAADLTGDGRTEVVVGTDQGGGPRVRVVDGATLGSGAPRVLADFFAIDDPNFRGGVRPALGDVNADGYADLVVSAGFGGGPRVGVFSGAGLARGQRARLAPDFFAFASSLRNGAYAAVGDVNADGNGDLVFGAGPGGGPAVLVVSGQALLSTGPAAAVGRPLGSFFAGDPASRQGVRVGVIPTDISRATIIAGAIGYHRAAKYRADGAALGNLSLPGGGGGVFVAGTAALTGPEYAALLDARTVAAAKKFVADATAIENAKPTVGVSAVRQKLRTIAADAARGATLAVYADFQSLGETLYAEAYVTVYGGLARSNALLSYDTVVADLEALATVKAQVVAFLRAALAARNVTRATPPATLFPTGTKAGNPQSSLGQGSLDFLNTQKAIDRYYQVSYAQYGAEAAYQRFDAAATDLFSSVYEVGPYATANPFAI